MNDTPGAGPSRARFPRPAPGTSGPLALASGRDLTVALLRPIGAAIVLLIGYFLLPINRASDLNVLGLTVGAGLLASFCVWEVRKFARSIHPLVTAMEMLVALATFYVVVFATTYFLFSEYDPGSFNEELTRIDALYFCLTVFTTTGFGDIAADSQGARIAVSIQMASTLVLVGLGLRFFNILINYRRQVTAG
ncbi:potassium channel family protein [Gordonia amicalis]|uniref:potassium channel family protein n=1 Tax=Gordonia amicalis TaxID=89053 RepID=UPI000406C958|nr:potassium channel family protein [Gordonia amicalis]